MCILLIPALTLTKLQKTANQVVKTLSGPWSFCLLYCHYPWIVSKTLIHPIFWERLQRPRLFSCTHSNIILPQMLHNSTQDRKIVCKHLGKIISTKSKRWAGQWLSFFRAIQILQQPGIYFVCVLLQCTPLCFLPKEGSQDSWNIWQRLHLILQFRAHFRKDTYVRIYECAV